MKFSPVMMNKKKNTYWLQLIVTSLYFIVLLANGAEPDTQEELDDLNRYREDINYDLVGFDDFTEQVDPWSRNLSVGHKDIILPGNGGLDLVVSRYYMMPDRRSSPMSIDRGKYPMGFRWNMHFGYISHSKIVNKEDILQTTLDTPLPGKSYSGCYDPNANRIDEVEKYYIASQSGSQQSIAPDASGESVVSSNGWIGGCTDSGWVMYSPGGVKYVYDKIKYGTFSKQRSHGQSYYNYGWYVSKIEDKHGNWIQINYTNDEQAIFDSINTSDGRTVDFTYTNIDNRQMLTQVTSATKTVNYSYDANRNLSSVRIGTRELWHYTYETLDDYDNNDTRFYLKTLKTESGGLYTYNYIDGGRSYSGEAESITVKSRKISGTLPSSTTTYATSMSTYQHDSYTVNEYGTGVSVIGNRRNFGATFIIENNRCTVHIFNDVDQGNWLTGKIAYKYVYQNPDCTNLLEKEEYQWDQVLLSEHGQLRKFYAYYVGYVGEVKDTSFWKAVLRKKIITREGNQYITTYSDFTDSGQPKTIIEHSSLDHKRTTESTYLNPGYQYGRDLLDTQLIKSDSGVVVSQLDYDYDTIYNIKKKTINGKSNSYGYFTDGSLNKITYEGSGRYDTLEDYYRGKARKVTQPCATTNGCNIANGSTANTVILKKEVYSDGKTKSITGFRGNKVSYSYDSIGRLSTIDYANSKWADTSIGYGIVLANNDGIVGSGIEAGSLRQTVSRGNFETVIYHDGLSRPVFIRTRDITDSATTQYQAIEYDTDGHKKLVTYTTAEPSARLGIKTAYDALGRQTSRFRNYDNSIISNTQYLSDYKMAVTDGENNTVTSTYLEYGTPRYALASLIVAPDTTDTTIDYNLIDQIKSIQQGNITESRLYDSNLRLCKTVRPEIGITAYGYNNRHQLAWLAQGTSGSTASCDATSVPASDKVVFGYDNLNQLHSESFSDISPDKTYGYDENGNLTSLTAGTVSQVYNYNNLNLLEDETLNIASKAFKFDYDYNSLGNLSSLQYPDGKEKINFSPNALGQPTQAIRINADTSTTEFVKGGSDKAIYHNGTLRSFTYGNGIKHITKLNPKQMPYCVRDYSGTDVPGCSNLNGSVVNLEYDYDNNGNITSIINGRDAGIYSLTSLTYDGANRLKTTTGGSGIGSSSLIYDGLGNILNYSNTSIFDSSNLTYGYSNNRLSSVTGNGSEGYNFNRSDSYDARGNVTHNGKRDFSYNIASQMISSGSSHFTYDGYNRRIKSVKDNSKTEYSMYSQSGKLLYRETDQGGINYIFLGNKLVAKEGTGVVSHNSIMNYKPFGDSIEEPKDDVGYTGHKFDTDLGLSYMQARYYDPVIGRFYSNDPVGFYNVHNFNRYSYVANNPYKYTDPDGRDYRAFYVSIKIPFVGALDVGIVGFTPNKAGEGSNTGGIFIRAKASASSVDGESSKGAFKQDVPIKGAVAGATVGVEYGSNTSETFDGTDASIDVGLGPGAVSVGGLTSNETSISFELGAAIGADASVSQTFSLTNQDVANAANKAVEKVREIIDDF